MTRATRSPAPDRAPDSAPDRAPRPRRLRGWLTAAAMLGLGAAAAWQGAVAGTAWIERRETAAARAALDEGSFDWAQVSADGLQVRLTGQAPGPVAQVRALAAVAGRLPAGRVVDATTLPTPAPAHPDFRLEILRSGQDVSAAGLTPASLDLGALTARLGHMSGGAARTELIERTSLPAPEGWDAALGFALDAAALAPRAKLSVTAGHVAIAAIVDGERDKDRLSLALREAVPEGVALTLDISAPRVAIVPFELALTRADGATRADSCAADSDSAQQIIIAALGMPAADCPVGLGAPSPRWGDAAVATIDALASLPAGRAVIRDTQVSLDGAASVPAADLASARRRLADALPPGFTVVPVQGAQGATQAAVAARFDAYADDDGIHLRGVISDERIRTAIDSLARTYFDRVDSALAIDPAVPPGWTLRLIAAVEALGALHHGNAAVTPPEIRISGDTDDPDAAAAMARRLAQRTGPGVPYRLALRYHPALRAAAGEACAARLTGALALDRVVFEQGTASLIAERAPAMPALAEDMRDCAAHRFAIEVRTDDTPDAMPGADLGKARANAVLVAMQAAGIGTANLAVQADSARTDGTAAESPAPDSDKGDRPAGDGAPDADHGPDANGAGAGGAGAEGAGAGGSGAEDAGAEATAGDGDESDGGDDTGGAAGDVAGAEEIGPEIRFRLLSPPPEPARPLDVLSGVTAALPADAGAAGGAVPAGAGAAGAGAAGASAAEVGAAGPQAAESSAPVAQAAGALRTMPLFDRLPGLPPELTAIASGAGLLVAPPLAGVEGAKGVGATTEKPAAGEAPNIGASGAAPDSPTAADAGATPDSPPGSGAPRAAAAAAAGPDGQSPAAAASGVADNPAAAGPAPDSRTDAPAAADDPPAAANDPDGQPARDGHPASRPVTRPARP